MTKIEEKELELKNARARTAKLDLELRKAKAEQEIHRIDEHIKLQDKIILETESKIKGGA